MTANTRRAVYATVAFVWGAVNLHVAIMSTYLPQQVICGCLFAWCALGVFVFAFGANP